MDNFQEHEHDENCDCCDQIALPMEDGSELVCDVIGTFDLNDKDYIVLLPVDEEEVVIYRYTEEDDDAITIMPIESDEEFNEAAETFHQLFAESLEAEGISIDEIVSDSNEE